VRGIDLADLFTGAMSWRRFGVILAYLPPESAYRTAVLNETDLDALPPPDPDVHGPWAHDELLLAAIIDRLGQLVWMQSDGKHPPPPPYPRPGVRSNVRAISPFARAYLAYLEEHQGAAPPADWQPDDGEVS
jgi:hypothetical protein